MNCPECYGNDTMHWVPAENVVVCRGCGHELTPREYRRETEGDWGQHRTSLSEEAT